MRLPVWDLPTRLFHWSLVAAVGVCAVSAFLLPPAAMAAHIAAGYVIGGLLLFRLVWAAAGPAVSRFSGFLPRPAAVLAHLRAMAAGCPPASLPSTSLGHNPAGGAMVLALLLTLGGLAASGLVVLGGADKQGPLAGLAPFAWAAALQPPHRLLAWGLTGLAALHLGGVLVEGRLTGERLIRAMLDGRKEVPPGTRPLAPARRGAPAALAVVAVLAAAGVAGLERLPARGWRPLAFPAAYAKECGACHGAYHPSLLPAASWERLMTSLDDHFGEDAGLPENTRRAIAAWLEAWSAEHWDTRPANRLRQVSPEEPRRITAAPWWRQRHRPIPAPVFARSSLHRANCAACHHDAAAGLFRPQAIALPSSSPTP